ncbi:MAG: hypothetical protein GY793_09680 [Proteobacteria bacterium]|nr:hypothetical protein [Pseudomonadota bacterium]
MKKKSVRIRVRTNAVLEIIDGEYHHNFVKSEGEIVFNNIFLDPDVRIGSHVVVWDKEIPEAKVVLNLRNAMDKIFSEMQVRFKQIHPSFWDAFYCKISLSETLPVKDLLLYTATRWDAANVILMHCKQLAWNQGLLGGHYGRRVA